MISDTKERILTTALKMFSEKGLAFAFTSPISSLIQLCDREPDR